MAHVLFLTFHLPKPDEPGAARPWEELQLMGELGCRVTVITASAHYLTEWIEKPVRLLWRRDVEDGVTVLRTWSPKHYRRSLARRLGGYLAYSLIMPLAALTARGVDVVFAATDPPFMTPGAYLAALIHRARLVLDERDIYPDTLLWLGIHPPRPIVWALSTWGAWLRRRAAAVVTVSPGFVRLLAERGARPQDIYFITNYFPHGTSDVADPPEISADGKTPMTVLYAGGLGAATDITALLDAATVVQSRGYADQIRFVFLGAGERRAEYSGDVAARDLRNVEFWDARPRSEMPAVFAGIHVAIHSLGPQWRNSLSSKIFEYMGHGRPVVFAGIGDIADVLAESGGGIAVPPEEAGAIADALIRLYDNPNERLEMGERARQYVQDRFNRPQIRRRLGEALGLGPWAMGNEPDVPPKTQSSRLKTRDYELITDDTTWDELVAACPDGEIFHTSAWLQLIEDVHETPVTRLGIVRDGRLVAGLPFLTRRMGPFTLAGSPLPGTATPQMGPVGIDDSAREQALLAFDRVQRERRISAAHLIFGGAFPEETLTRLGYEVEPHRTMLLDLEGKSEQDIWNGFKSECRTAVRKAEKSGVEVSFAEHPSFVPEYYLMAQEVFGRQGRPAPTSGRFYGELWRYHGSGTLQVLIARHEGKIVAGAMFLAHRRRLYYLDGASYSAGSRIRANNLIHWTILKWAAANNIETYDMVGADTPELIRFKGTFGSELVERHRARRSNSRLAAISMDAYLRVRPLVRRGRHLLQRGRRSAVSGQRTASSHWPKSQGRDQDKHRAELERLRSVYARRPTDVDLQSRYDASNPGNRINRLELEREMRALIRRHFGGSLAGQNILEVGCGTGGFLPTLEQYGAEAARYHGIDLMPALIDRARQLRPEAHFQVASAHQLPFPDGTFDIACQVTVLTSVLDPDLRAVVVREMDRVLRPGGRVIWWDYWTNPTNPEARGIRKREIAQLFPGYDLDLRQITLAPPLARRIGRYSATLCRLLSQAKPLRTHYIGILTKPGVSC